VASDPRLVRLSAAARDAVVARRWLEITLSEFPKFVDLPKEFVRGERLKNNLMVVPLTLRLKLAF
jgi:hypothetical protein